MLSTGNGLRAEQEGWSCRDRSQLGSLHHRPKLPPAAARHWRGRTPAAMLQGEPTPRKAVRSLTLPCPTDQRGDGGSPRLLSLSHRCLLTPRPDQGCARCLRSLARPKHVAAGGRLPAHHPCCRSADKVVKTLSGLSDKKDSGQGEYQRESINTCQVCSKDDKPRAGGRRGSAGTICPEQK